MIIDCILDRLDMVADDFVEYEPHEFYCYVSDYGGYWAEKITSAMDCGDEKCIQDALCGYIDGNEYNPLIKDYIRAVNWGHYTSVYTDMAAAKQFRRAMANR